MASNKFNATAMERFSGIAVELHYCTKRSPQDKNFGAAKFEVIGTRE